MKRLIFLFVLILGISTMSFSQTVENVVDTVFIDNNNAIQQVNDSAELTALMVYNDFKAGIQGLAQSLKEPAEHVYSVLIKQQYVKAWIGVALLFITIVFILISIKLLLFNKNSYIYGEIDDVSAGGVIGIIIGIISLVLLLTFLIGGYFTDILQGFINPEYGAIRDIVNFIR